MSSIAIDILAAGWLLGCWLSFDLAIHRPHRRIGLSAVMNQVRQRWAVAIVQRENRVADSGLLGNIMRGASFYASTSLLILLACFALLGTIEEARTLLARLPLAHPGSLLAWEFKIIALGLIFIYAFFIFSWALRQFNHCCALVGALPTYSGDHEQSQRAASGLGFVISQATRSLNLGIRAYYFGLATALWLIHPLLMVFAASIVLALLFHREFYSQTRQMLLTTVLDLDKPAEKMVD